MRQCLALLVLLSGLAPAMAQPVPEMSLLQAGLVIGRDVFAQKCPQHIAVANKVKHAAELAYVKGALTPDAGEQSYDATRKRIETAFRQKGACDIELKKHKAQTYPQYTYSNVVMKK